MPNRRTFLRQLAASGLTLPTFYHTLQAQTDGLRYRAAAKNMFYGAATSEDRLRTDAAYRQAMIRECGIITPEYEMKWDRMRPSATTYNFVDSDYIVNFARQNGMLVHGHTLCWHRALPSWFFGTVNRSNAEQFLRDHIQAVVGRYRGQIHSWDVVNEVIETQDNTFNKLRNSLWYQYLGENYVDIAFRAAAQTDPSALLVYNEYGVEFDDNARRDAILGLLQRLKARRVPIHALGIQGHLRTADSAKFNANTTAFRKFLSDVAALGLKIIITEFDTDDRSLPTNTQQRDDGVGRLYGDFCSVVMNNPAVIGFITWGLTDKYTELNTSAPRPDRQPQRPLPLDLAMQRKSAWYALEWWFNNTSARPRTVTSVTAEALQQAPLDNVRCAPNPVSSWLDIQFRLEGSSQLSVSIIDSRGRVIATLANEVFQSGEHHIRWDAQEAVNGLYWCSLKSLQGQTAIPVVVAR